MVVEKPTRPFDRVELRKVTRVYGATRALAGVSLTLRAGEVTAVEGHNGAGKSTLLAIVATLARPTAGTVRFGELDGVDDVDLVRPALGLVAHEALVYPDLTGREALRLAATLYDLPRPQERVEAVLAAHRLRECADRAARTLSRGQLQRLALARATLHDPTLLLFDEPTTGLDREASERATRSIEEAREAGRIVVVVTHDAALAARVGDQRVVLERGRVASLRRREETSG